MNDIRDRNVNLLIDNKCKNFALELLVLSYLMRLTPFPCNCKLTSLNFVKISVDCDSHYLTEGGTVPCPPSDPKNKKMYKQYSAVA